MPLAHVQGKGILMVRLEGREAVGGVERGMLLAPRRDKRLSTRKRVVIAERVVVFGVTYSIMELQVPGKLQLKRA